MLDPLVDTFMCRDIDSDILPREVPTVEEWLESNKTFHMLRDIKMHGYPIQAGLWGGRSYFNRTNMFALGNKMLRTKPVHKKEFDQNLLQAIVWPVAKFDSVVHDCFHCEKEKLCPPGVCRPFPTRRNGTLYTGWGATKNKPTDTLVLKCPVACRPQSHKDWDYC